MTDSFDASALGESSANNRCRAKPAEPLLPTWGGIPDPSVCFGDGYSSAETANEDMIFYVNSIPFA